MTYPAVSFYTLGCRLNQSETAVLENSLQEQGYTINRSGTPSDIAVIHTCTVTHRSDTDTRRLVHKINRMGPKTQIALIGCQSQMQSKQLALLPNVKWVIGTADKMQLGMILTEFKNPRKPKIIITPIPTDAFTNPTAGIDHTHTRANIKIQDGCNFFCTYCEIPYARGRARSRKFADIMQEAKILAKAGHRELVITGINVGMYHHNNKNIIDVIKALTRLRAINRIRISSIEPTTIPFELLHLMKQNSKLCRHLHIPLQSAEDKILKRMNRKYTSEEFFDFITQAYNAVPRICIGTDIMVGFPGETDSDFQQTYQFLKRSPIHYFHVFSYSPRQKARSKKLKQQVPTRIIKTRSEQLRSLSQQKRHDYYKTFLGETCPVLFEQKKDGFWKGLTDHFVHVKVKTNKYLHNELLNVNLLETKNQEIIGKLSG